MNELHFPAYIEVSQNRFRERFGLDFEDFQAGANLSPNGHLSI